MSLICLDTVNAVAQKASSDVLLESVKEELSGVGDEVEDLACPGQEPLHSWLPVHFPTRTIFKVTF